MKKAILALVALMLVGLSASSYAAQYLPVGFNKGAASQVAQPVDSPGAGSYGSTQSVTLTDATGSAVICFRTDGTNPAATTPGTCDAGSTTYSGAFNITVTSTLKALGTKVGLTNSTILTSVYTIGGAVTWTLIQHPHNFTCAGTAGVGTVTCTVTTSSVTSGNLLVLVTGFFVGAQTSVPPAFGSATGDAGLIHCPSQLANENYNGAGNSYESVDCAYALSAVGGSTSFTWGWQTNSGGGSYDINVSLYEYHRSTGTATYETCGAGGAAACVTTSASCSTCTGPVPTVTGTDVVVASNANENNCTAVASPFNVSPSPDVDSVNVFGITAWSLSQSSGNATVYTCPTGGAAMMAAAFK